MKNQKLNKASMAQKTLISLGLASLLPSFSLADEAVENLKKVLDQQGKDAESQKVQTLQGYSPVVDLRQKSSRLNNDGDQIFSANPVVINGNTTIGSLEDRWNVTTDEIVTKASKNITINNNATLEIFATNNTGFGYIFAGTNNKSITWSGGNIKIDFLAHGWGGTNRVRGGLSTTEGRIFTITSNLDFTYREEAKGANDFRAVAVAAVGAQYDGVIKLLGDQVKINAIGDSSQNENKGIFALMTHENGSIYLNAQDDGSLKNKNAVIQVNGSISTDMKGDRGHGSGKIYAHFTGKDSYLRGNIYSGCYGGGSKLNITFSGGASMTGNIAIEKDSQANITFSNGASMTGDIDINGGWGHSNFTFDQASFRGSVKNSSGNDNSTNTTITFKNTSGKVFSSQNGTGNIIETSFKGTVKGSFDLSRSSGTQILGGINGEKGFMGGGRNILTFDFKNDAGSNAFAVGQGTNNSRYVFKGVTKKGTNELDLSNLSSTTRNDSTFFGKIKEQTNVTIGQDIRGALVFTHTNMKVGNGNNALFAGKENIGLGSSQPAMVAMFGNASWNDENNDGRITGNEIIAHENGTNYKLSSNETQALEGSTTDSRTSTGNIGASSDVIKKHIGFIFANGVGENQGYEFNGDKQGYSGTIAGGTRDSKYYFANAGYINRNQIENSAGEIVLFNTAFRGDLGVKNKNVKIMLDFSDGKNGLRNESGMGHSNIVGAGSKTITFNFTGNTNQEKYKGAVVGNAEKVGAKNQETTDADTAKYTMLNLKKHTSDKVEAANHGMLAVEGTRDSKTLIDAIQEAGLTNFNKQDSEQLKNYEIPNNSQTKTTSKDKTTNVELLSTTKTTLALRGTSLDATNLSFDNYIYDFAFGTNMGKLEGVTIADSKLKGNIDLSSNTNAGHRILLKGDSFEGDELEIKFGGNNFASNSGGAFVYDDSTATTTTTPKTLKLSGLSTTNFLQAGSSLNFTKTNLEVDALYANDSVSVNLDFRDGRTLAFDEMGFKLKNYSNIIVHGKINPYAGNANPLVEGQAQQPKIKLEMIYGESNVELINTGAQLIAKHSGEAHWDWSLANSFNLRGTSFKIDGSELVGNVKSGSYNMVFAKGNALETIVTSAERNGQNYKITDQGVDTGYVNGEKLNHTGSYNNGVYDGNHIAQSSMELKKFSSSNTAFNFTFIGEQSLSFSGNAASVIKRNSTLNFINGAGKEGDSSGLSAGKLRQYFMHDHNAAKITFNLQGTSLHSGGWLLRKDDHNNGVSNQANMTFNMTFIKEEADSVAVPSSGESTVKYVDGGKYADLATTNANGALADSVLKVAESSLNGGIDFKNSNFNVLFVGDGAQNLDGSGSNGDAKIFKGGSASSVVTFRDSDLNAGNGTSSLQDIKGKIVFDLSHSSEDMNIKGTLKNMFGGSGKYQTKFSEGVSFDHLVFASQTEGEDKKLGSLGVEFNDVDVFGATLSAQDFSAFNALAPLTQGSKLTANGLTLALNGTSQEIFFIGADSHGFGATASVGEKTQDTTTKLGNSTGSTLTFIDAGELKVENIVNKGSDGAQQGKGTINLIGKSSIELKMIGAGKQAVKTLTLYDANTPAGTPEARNAITGEGITINAVFTGTNALGASSNGITTFDSTPENTIPSGHKASTANIGQVGEKTIYHILFDYTSSFEGEEKLGFGKYHAYTGTITGLTSDSIIKFKNSGYITGEQIANTDATILLDNTQLRSDFRGDQAILDYRNDKEGISGNILTSDIKDTNAVLSRKKLTFDFTGTTKVNASLKDRNIQAGYKIAPEYTQDGQSILTFQNAPKLKLSAQGTKEGGATTTSAILKGIASATGFTQLSSAKTTADGFSGKNDKNTYILSGTELVLQGTSVDASNAGGAITENDYNLKLIFDYRMNGRGQTDLGEDIKRTQLNASSITMGSAKQSSEDEATPLGLSLVFKGSGALVGNGTLNVNLVDGARFNLEALSYDGSIGTIVLNGSTSTRAIIPPFGAPALEVSKDSSLSINLGSMGFVGDFVQSETASRDGSEAGAINVGFGKNTNANSHNKAYGILSGTGEMKINLSGDALFSKEEARKLGYNGRDYGVNLLIDASSATSSNIVLAHSSGIVGVIGKDIAANSTSIGDQAYTNLDLNNVGSDVALKGAFNIGASNLNFTQESGKTLTLAGDTILNTSVNNTIKIDETLRVESSEQEAPVNLAIKTRVAGENKNNLLHLTLTNLGDKANVYVYGGSTIGWSDGGNWNIRGTNIGLVGRTLTRGGTKTFVFANGAGTEVIKDSASQEQSRSNTLTLDKLEGSDKVAHSSLLAIKQGQQSGDNATSDKGFYERNASFTFIGKTALKANETDQIISGLGNAVTINFYNGLVKSGSVIFNIYSNDGTKKNVEIRGTDTFNFVASKNDNVSATNSIINAVFINGTNVAKASKTTAITGENYVNVDGASNEALKATLSQYATSTAGGALSEHQLKTMESKAYGHITMDNTVTANMKFIGENSHSFDGKTVVYQNASPSNITDDKIYYSDIALEENRTKWKQVQIGADGKITLNSNNGSSWNVNQVFLATLSGGNANSRFDFDHTTVRLNQVKYAGGKTLVYNSKVSGEIAVTANGGTITNGTIQDTSSTTLFFNAKMGSGSTLDEPSSVQQLTDIAKTYIDYHYTSANTGFGINLDLSSAHQMVKENLHTNATEEGAPQQAPTYTLGATEKQTNIILIGKNSVDTGNASAIASKGGSSNNNGAGIDLSFLPDATKDGTEKYSYTIISGGELDGKYLNTILGGDGIETPDNSGVGLTVFGKSRVILVDTEIVGERNFAQVGFIDTNDSRNQKSSWGGGAHIEQFLIFDFYKGANNQKLNNGSGNVITNTDSNSRYIFTNIFAENEERVIWLSKANDLRNTINTTLKKSKNTTQDVIGSNVKGYLGLRGVSVVGSINEDMRTPREDGKIGEGNSVDIVFNSTEDISYVDGFDESGKHTFVIQKTGYNKVANIYGIDNEKSNIAGYAVFKEKKTRGEKEAGTSLEITGSAHKDIVFIGEKSVQDANGQRAFERLKISGGSKESNYTFYAVGTLGDAFLQGVRLQQTHTDDGQFNNTANVGTFSFGGETTIHGDINVNAPTDETASKLIFDGVHYSGNISGTLRQELKFGANSDFITIKGGNPYSSYDFSALAGQTIHLDINLSSVQATPYEATRATYLASSIKGFEEGNISLVGSINVAKSQDEVQSQDILVKTGYTNTFAFYDDAQWIVTDSSQVMNLSLSNEDINFNLDLASASRIKDLSDQPAQPQPSAEEATGEAGSQPSAEDLQKAYESSRQALGFRTLKTSNLASFNGQVLLGTQINTQDQTKSYADRIETDHLSGTLYVTAKDVALKTVTLKTGTEDGASVEGTNLTPLVLVSANNAANAEVKGAEHKRGLSIVKTELEHQVSTDRGSSWEKINEEMDNQNRYHRWVLSSISADANQDAVDESSAIVSNPYRMLMIETNNLNKRMGDLRGNEYSHGAWIRIYNGMDSGEGVKNLYTNIQLGYDYGVGAIGAKNYTGVAFSTSIVDISGSYYNGKSNTYSFALYDSYIADNGFYVDMIAKYMYTDQKLSPFEGNTSSFGNHSFSLGMEMGYQAYVAKSNFYFEPQAEVIYGLIAGVKDINLGSIGGQAIQGEMQTINSFYTRVGVMAGYMFHAQNGFRADVRFGASLVSEQIINEHPLQFTDQFNSYQDTLKDDLKAVVNVGTNLVITDKWRVYIDLEKSFGGHRNTDYQANVGARFSFGEKALSIKEEEEIIPLKLKNLKSQSNEKKDDKN